MDRLHSMIVLLTLFLVTCGRTTSPATIATNSPPPASTLDACAGATTAGARQRFTFEQIVPCLKTVPQVSAFMANNVKYDVEYDTRERGGNEYVPASIVYERGIDDADGYAILQCYLLERNSWDAFMLGLSIETPVGSNVCAVNTNGTILVLESTGQTAGPFNSLADLAKHYISKNWMQGGGFLKSLKASQVTQVTTDRTSPSVLGLAWVSHAY